VDREWELARFFHSGLRKLLKINYLVSDLRLQRRNFEEELAFPDAIRDFPQLLDFIILIFRGILDLKCLDTLRYGS